MKGKDLRKGAWGVGDITAITGAPNAASGSNLSTLVDALNGYVRIYYVGADQHVHELAVNSGGWGSGDITVITGSGNAMP